MEIPLERGAQAQKGRGNKSLVIGFVDMDLIYQQFPETKKARQDYQIQADKIKQALSDKEAELDDLREQLSILSAAEGSHSASTATVPGSSLPPAGLGSAPAMSTADKARMLADDEKDLAAAKKEAAAALLEFERIRAQQIFGKLYKSLVQLADEKGVDMVLDKSSLLYGQGGLDLTDALSRRVRGLPDEDADK